MKELQSLGDALREQLGTGVAVLGSAFEDGKTHRARRGDRRLRARGVSRGRDREGDRRGSRRARRWEAHMAQAGLPDPAALTKALDSAPGIARAALAKVA